VLNIASQSKIFFYIPPADMRKGIDGLSGIVRAELNSDPTDGSLFVFVNRRRDRMKILHFTEGGFWLYYRVLEAGSFESLTQPHDGACVTIDATELSMLLSGVSLAGSRRRRKRYRASERAA
jgi:transposase